MTNFKVLSLGIVIALSLLATKMPMDIDCGLNFRGLGCQVQPKGLSR